MNFEPPAPQPQNNLEDEAEDGWGHWAMGNEQDNAQPMQLDQDVGLNNLLQAMEADEILVDQHDQPVQDEHSGLTISISSSEGASSVNPANQIVPPGEEVQQPLGQDLNLGQQALGQNLIGLGLMNIIQAYQDEDKDEILDVVNPNEGKNFMFDDVNIYGVS
jgi:hypothetical protein